MRSVKAFVLFEALLCSVMAIAATSIVVQSLKTYVDWQRASHMLLSSLLYEQHALFCLYRDLSVAQSVEKSGASWRIHKLFLDTQWQPSRHTIIYDVRHEGVFRQLKRYTVKGDCIASSVRLWAHKVDLCINQENRRYEIKWRTLGRRVIAINVPRVGAY